MILIENNVITKKNLKRFSKNPFLMTKIDETRKIMINTDDNVRLLVDVAHLKISAKTLNYNPKDYLIKLDNFIEAYHLSDNNGISDQNENVTEKAGFGNTLKKMLHF